MLIACARMMMMKIGVEVGRVGRSAWEESLGGLTTGAEEGILIEATKEIGMWVIHPVIVEWLSEITPLLLAMVLTPQQKSGR
jgi:hypothetical protein